MAEKGNRMSDEQEGIQQQNPDGSWSPATALGWQGSDIDFEVYRDGKGWRWEAFDEDVLVGVGTSRTRLGLSLSTARAKRRLAAAGATTRGKQ